MLHNKIRIIKAAGAAVLALAMTTAMSGCGSYWNGYSEAESRQLIEDALEEKYGEEFVVKDIRTRSGSSWDAPPYLSASCSPKDNETIYFEAEYFAYGDSYDLVDLYIQSIVRKQIKDVIDPVLAEHFDDFATDVYIYGLSSEYDSGIRNADETTIASFSRAINQDNKINSSTIWIILENSEIKSQDEMIEILSKFTDELHAMWVGIDVYYVPKKILDECKELTSIETHNTNDINKLVETKYLLHEYTYNGEHQTLKFYKETDYEELRRKLEDDREKNK